jgi:hypothetical protein
MYASLDVLGGLNITVEFNECNPEDCDFKIVAIQDRNVSHLRSQWLISAIEKKGETQKVLDACEHELFLNKFYQ